MVPVGGIYTIDSEKARRMMAQIEPKVIIPMHYRDGEAGVQEPLQGVVVFDAGKIRGLFRCAVFKKIV